MKAHTYNKGLKIAVPVAEKLLATMLYTLRTKRGFGKERLFRFFESFEYNFIKMAGEVARKENKYIKETLEYLNKKKIHVAHIQEEAMKDCVKQFKFKLDMATIADIAMLRTLSETFGFGRTSCVRFYSEVNEVAEEMRNKFRSNGDDGHYEVMLSRLKDDGIDVKQWIKEMEV